MFKNIKLNKINIPFLILIATFLVTMISTFIKASLDATQAKSKIIEKSLSGIIENIRIGTRGNYYLVIVGDSVSKTSGYYLPRSFFIEDNKILKGDSVSKDGNSNILNFYKKERGIFKKCCYYEIN